MSGIFVSYRREDSSAYAGRLYDLFVSSFGRDRVFMDLDSIGPGEDFRTVIEQTCSSCRVLLAVIGKSWATARDKTGNIRLESETDFVRLEIASALTNGLRVIPVLVGRAEMPDVTSLPVDIKSLAFRNAYEISDRRFHRDVQELIDEIQKILGIGFRKNPPPRPTHDVQDSLSTAAISDTVPAKSSSLVTTVDKKDELRAVSPEIAVTRKESLLDEQRRITKAILNIWLQRGSRHGPDEEMERLQCRSEEVKKELLDLKIVKGSISKL
jgi:hypothetical protein